MLSVYEYTQCCKPSCFHKNMAQKFLFVAGVVDCLPLLHTNAFPNLDYVGFKQRRAAVLLSIQFDTETIFQQSSLNLNYL